MAVFRQRLTLECCGCKKNPSFYDVYQFLIDLTKVTQMRVLIPPLIVEVPVQNASEMIYTEKDKGISGTMVWLESGVQIHTWPEEKLVAIDMFSCKPYSTKEVISLVQDFFEPTDIDIVLNNIREKTI